MTSLFNLTGNYLKVKQLAEQGADEQLIMDTLESIDDEIETKADGYANLIKHIESDNDMIDKEVKRLQAMKKTNANTIKRMKENLLDSMRATDKQKIKTGLNHLYIRSNPHSLVIDKEDNIPEEYYKVRKSIDTQKLKSYLKDHPEEQIDGVGLQKTESVIIK
jgi:Mg2+ and Co2+ transporter CorA